MRRELTALAALLERFYESNEIYLDGVELDCWDLQDISHEILDDGSSLLFRLDTSPDGAVWMTTAALSTLTIHDTCCSFVDEEGMTFELEFMLGPDRTPSIMEVV